MTYWIINTLIVFALCVLLAGVLIPQILLIAYRRNLFDEVDERKIHKGLIPRLGGIAFMPVMLLSIVFVIGGNIMYGTPYFGYAFFEDALMMVATFCSLQMLYLVGLADDLIGIKYRAKFVVQLICAALIISAGCWFHTLAGALGINEFPSLLAIPFTAVVIVFIINAINLIDGIDGLASGLSSIAAIIYGVSFFVMGEYAYTAISFATLGVLVPFFYYNVFGDAKKHSKIFMGDTGSLTLGGIIAVYAILIHKELLLPILCALFYIEDLSVMLQVIYYKKTGGRRIFKMAPLHHHFQKPGNAGIDALIQKPLQAVPEAKIVTRFWIIGIILAVVTFVTLKIR